MNSANLVQYFRHSFRLLRRSPVFSAVVVVMLALGIGANTAVFSVVDGVLLRKLPYRDPDRLVMVWEKNPTLGASIGERVPANYTNFAEWARQSSACAIQRLFRKKWMLHQRMTGQLTEKDIWI